MKRGNLKKRIPTKKVIRTKSVNSRPGHEWKSRKMTNKESNPCNKTLDHAVAQDQTILTA